MTSLHQTGVASFEDLTDEDCLPTPPIPDPHTGPLQKLFKIAKQDGTTPVDIRRARRFADECIALAGRGVPFSPDTKSDFFVSLFVQSSWHYCHSVSQMCVEVLKAYIGSGLVDVNRLMDVSDMFSHGIEGKQLPLKRAILRGNMAAAEALIAFGADVNQIVPGKDWVEFVSRYMGHHGHSAEWHADSARIAAAEHLRKMCHCPESVEFSAATSNPPLTDKQAHLQTFQDLVHLDLCSSEDFEHGEELRTACVDYLRAGVGMGALDARYFLSTTVASMKWHDAFDSIMRDLYRAYIDAGVLDVNGLYEADDDNEGVPPPSLLAAAIRLANLNGAAFLVEHGAQLLPSEGDLSTFTMEFFPVTIESRSAAAARLVQARMSFSIQQQVQQQGQDNEKGQSSGLLGADTTSADSTLTVPADSAVILGLKQSTRARRAL